MTKGKPCHVWMNFIPKSFMSSIDMDDPEEVARWNRIFHYQRHPNHRPPLPDNDFMTNQKVWTGKHTMYGKIITEIDTGQLPMVGKLTLDNGAEIWCRQTGLDTWEIIRRRRGYGRR